MENKTITLTLPVQDVNMIMEALSQMPFIRVADLITKVREQGTAQLQAPAEE